MAFLKTPYSFTLKIILCMETDEIMEHGIYETGLPFENPEDLNESLL